MMDLCDGSYFFFGLAAGVVITAAAVFVEDWMKGKGWL